VVTPLGFVEKFEYAFWKLSVALTDCQPSFRLACGVLQYL